MRLLQPILEAVDAPVLALERGADGVVRLVGANHQACRLFGLDEAGAQTARRLDEALPPMLAADLRVAAETGSSEAVVHWAGQGGLTRLTVRPLPSDALDPDSGTQRLLCTATAAASSPVPETTMLEADIRRMRLRLLDRLIARGGHALGNYLQPVLTFSHYAMGDIPAETRNAYLGHVLEAGEQIQSLIAVTRIVGRAGLAAHGQLEDVSIDHLLEDVEDVCPMLLPLDVAARAEIEAVGAKAHGCRGDLILVLINLILDAADTMAHKGEIVLRARRGAWADGLEGAPCLRIDVESTGARRSADDGPHDMTGMLGLVRRCGGGLGIVRPAPERVRVSLYLPEAVAGAIPA